MAEELQRLARNGKTEIVGICAGFQILGARLLDPHRLESTTGQPITGLGLLPLTHTLAETKTLVQAEALHIPSGLSLKGYEIHHGKINETGLKPCVNRFDGKPLGAASENGLVWGSYLHGIFDDDRFRRWFLDSLRTRKGLEPLVGIQAVYDLEPALDRLASEVRANMDIKQIYRMMGLK
jgi:cobyric acid synthase